MISTSSDPIIKIIRKFGFKSPKGSEEMFENFQKEINLSLQNDYKLLGEPYIDCTYVENMESGTLYVSLVQILQKRVGSI